jgi:hypothetical protein
MVGFDQCACLGWATKELVCWDGTQVHDFSTVVVACIWHLASSQRILEMARFPKESMSLYTSAKVLLIKYNKITLKPFV